VAVERDPGVAGHLLDALEDFAGQHLAVVALAEFRALGIVVLVQLKVDLANLQFVRNHFGQFFDLHRISEKI
jgi:hypothetical protein